MRDFLFQNNRDITFWNFFDIHCYLLQLIIHVQYVTNITASYEGFGSYAIGLFGFSFLVVIEIGSLARFMCFSNVALSCIF